MKPFTTRRLQSILTSSYVMLFLVILAISVLFYYWNYQQEQLDKTNEIRYQSTKLADEIRQSSDDLTRMARSYVITGDTMFKQQFTKF